MHIPRVLIGGSLTVMAAMILLVGGLLGSGCGGGGSSSSTTTTATGTTGQTYFLTPEPTQNGSITPSTQQTVDAGGAASFTATPNSGSTFQAWTLDGQTPAPTGTLSDGTTVSINNGAASSTISFAHVEGSHSLSASFASGAIVVSITPGAINLLTGEQATFTATVQNATNTAVTWSANGGTISSAGVFTAPLSAGNVTITASSVQNSQAKATVQIPIYTPALAASDWPKYQHDIANSGAGPAPAVSPTIAATKHIGASSDCSPVFGADGFLYLGDGSGNIDQIDPSTLAIVSSYQLASRASVDGGLLALADDSVVIAAEDGNIYRVAFSTTPPSLRWQASLGSGAGNVLRCSPTISPAGVIYCGSQSGKLLAFDPKSGSVLHAFDTGGPIQSTPAIAANSGTIWIPNTHAQVYMLSPTLTQTAMFAGSSGFVGNSVALDPSGNGYIGGWDSNFYAITPGGSNLHPPLSVFPQRISCSATIPPLGSPQYFGCASGVYSVAANGSQLWKYPNTPGGFDGGFLVDQGLTVYGADTLGNVYAIHPSDGTLVSGWPVTLASGSLGYQSPAMSSSGALFIWDDSGTLTAIGTLPPSPRRVNRSTGSSGSIPSRSLTSPPVRQTRPSRQ